MYLAIKSVSKRFGSVRAVSNVSWSCNQGELVAILGPSGCGKTTLLRMVAGFESPDAGTIHLDRELLNSLPPERRRVGMLFQNYALFPHMTVSQNIGYGLRFGPRANSQAVSEVVAELLELVDLVGYETRRPDQLSAGQQQRIAIARALAPRPRLLLLDEPLSALDAALRDHLRLNIRRIQRALGLTALYVTHDQEEAMSIADRIILMRQGKIEQQGRPEDIYERPATPFAASFFGRTALISTRYLPTETLYQDGRPALGLVVLRAERVHTVGPGVPLRGKLTEVEYLGHMLRLTVEGSFGAVWATAPGPEIAHWSGQRGNETTVYFDPGTTPTVPEP